MRHTLDTLTALGFDRSARFGERRYAVGCSQCEALVINGVPTHESGCPHATRECRGCNNRIPARQTWCEDCR